MHYAPIYRISLVRDGRLPYETPLRQSSDVARFVRPLFDGLDREQFVVVLLNAKHRPIGAPWCRSARSPHQLCTRARPSSVPWQAMLRRFLSATIIQWVRRTESGRHRDHQEASTMRRPPRHPPP